MPMQNNVVLNNYKERDFFYQLITTLMGESIFTSAHTLECRISSDGSYGTKVETTAEINQALDNVYVGSVTNNYPTYFFIIDGKVRIQLQRAYSLNNATNEYVFYSQFYNTAGDSKTITIVNSSSSKGYSENATRMIKYQIVTNNNALFIRFGGYSEGGFPITATHIDSLLYSENNDTICGNGGTMVDSNNTLLSCVDRLKYVNSLSNETSIETIQNKVVIDVGSREKKITMSNIWDSTYNAAVMFKVNIGNTTYVYINNYTVMPITLDNT